jgi:tight adherence protein B
MSPTLVSLAWSAVVVVACSACVRPVAVRGSRRPRAPFPSPHGAVPSKLSCPVWFERAAERAALPEPVDRWFWAGFAVVVVGSALGLVVGGAVLGFVAGLGIATACGILLRAGRHRADERLTRAVPDSLDAVARSTRAGSSVVQALASLVGGDASPADELFGSVASQVERGASLDVALVSVRDQRPLPAIRLAIAALLVGSETGAAPARAVDGVAATLRDRAALEREAAAHATQARASVGVLVLAPLGFGLFAVAADPRVGDFLFRTPLGVACLVLGVGLDALGAWWMARIVEAAR